MTGATQLHRQAHKQQSNNSFEKWELGTVGLNLG